MQSTFVRAAIVLAGLGILYGQKPAAFPPSSAFTSAMAMRTVEIIDRVLQTEAYSFKIPADWIFEGTIVPGPSCSPPWREVIGVVADDGND